MLDGAIRIGLFLVAVCTTGTILGAAAHAGDAWGPLLPVEWQAARAKGVALAVAGGTAILALEGEDYSAARDLVLRDARTGAILWRTASPPGVTWHSLGAGREVALVTQMQGHRLPTGGAYRLADGLLLWTQTLGKNEGLAVGEDGTGVASWDFCSLQLRDPVKGSPVKLFNGKTSMVGHFRDGKSYTHGLCVSLPRLLGEAFGRAIALQGDPAVLWATDRQGRGWSLALSKGAGNTGADLETGLVWHIDDLSRYQNKGKGLRLVLQRLDLTTGKELWRRELPGTPLLSQLTRLVPGPEGKPVLLIQTGTQAKLVAPEDGKDLCSIEVGSGVAVVVGEERQPVGWAFGASGLARTFVWITPTCQRAGQGEVDAGTRPLLHPDGFVLFRALEWMALQQRDGRERWRAPVKTNEVRAIRDVEFDQ